MNYEDAMEYSPTTDEIVRELERHGHDCRVTAWNEFVKYCEEFQKDPHGPGVLLGYLGY